ncbi:hypothetical protein KI387_036391, partial [Taxus chinensis]
MLEVESQSHAVINKKKFTATISMSSDDNEFGDFESVPAYHNDESFLFAPDSFDEEENDWGEFVQFNTNTKIAMHVDRDISEPLPLFLFGEEELDVGGGVNLLINEDFERVKTPNGNGSLSGVDLSDFITTLYKQAENEKEEDANKGISLQLNYNDSHLWELKDAFFQHAHANNRSGDGDESHFQSQLVREYVSYENKGSEVTTFYVKLRTYAHSVALGHLSQLEKTLLVVSQSNMIDEAETITKEIQEAREKLKEASGVLEPLEIEDHRLENTVVGELLEHLHHSSLLVFDSAFFLSELIPAAKENIKEAVDLYRHAVWVLLLVSTSGEHQSSYLNVWAIVTSACVTELQHGLKLWNQASHANVDMHILSHPQGKSYFASLVEIFRVSQILRASMKLYKPWILLNGDQTKYISHNLENCMAAWNGYGLKEAVHHAFARDDGTNQVTPTTWKGVEEIVKPVGSMEELFPGNALYNANREYQPVCRLSLLPTKVFDGLKVVDWSGQSYFLPLANLWAN